MKFIKNKKFSSILSFSKYSLLFILSIFILMPVFTNIAQATTDTNKNTTSTIGIDFHIKNPITVNTITDFMVLLLNIVLTIGVPIVALAFIYCGFLFVTARGSKEAITTAKRAILYTVIGAFLLLGAWVLATAIKTTVEEVTTTNNSIINQPKK